MSRPAHPNLQQALQLTVEMLEAADGGNWERVSQLDAQRHRLLHSWKPQGANAQDRAAIDAMQTHNQSLMAHAEAARNLVQRQLDQHQYNHRALRTYISSSALG
ncbi:flagellar protein FliT [Dyella acidiphila]|uniref:Flagellar protein FliT n=1 Tax=Dyella acidiphila TaxID=2775866 RepID=A0ABR9G666_9GAMM|nr:flagellar protein FliT [Dyella acidiphila]MBE1159520.1 flagellar protein FliT [Dyella acidiphila]